MKECIGELTLSEGQQSFPEKVTYPLTLEG